MAKRALRSESNSPAAPSKATRRDFLKGATTVAAGMIANPLASAENPNQLPTVTLGTHRVSRLIVGSNPIRGISHFNPQYSRQMAEWFTDGRVVQLLLDCEKAGINTFQSSYYPPRLPRHLELARQAGSKLQWICLTSPTDVPPANQQTPEWLVSGSMKCAEEVARFQPIACVHHGNDTEVVWRAGKIDLLKAYLNKVHDLGLLAGVSVHDPRVLEIIESKGWPIDFYMTAFYFQSREPEDFKREIGVIPVGETYLSDDPARMCRIIRQVKKTCLAYKVLAAGRRCESSHEVRQAFEFAYQNIKPTDAVIVGMYPRDSDQVGENTRTVREILA
jgi:hypothetical protein